MHKVVERLFYPFWGGVVCQTKPHHVTVIRWYVTAQSPCNLTMQSEEPCEPCELDLDTEWRELDALTVVDTVRADQVAEKASSSNNARVKDRVICTLWCGSSHPAGDHRQPMVKCNQSTVPTIEHAVRALRLKIQEKHADCIAVAEAARAAAGGPHTRPAPDALAALMAARKAQQGEICIA